MCATATAIFLSSPDHLFGRRRDPTFFFDDPAVLSSRRSSSAAGHIFLRYPYSNSTPKKRTSILTPAFKPLSPVMEWQDCKVKMDIDVPTSVAYNCYSDREAIPRWMPFISSVKFIVPELSILEPALTKIAGLLFGQLLSKGTLHTNEILEDKPDLSRWSLKYKAFGRDIEFSWLARNMQPIRNQKIHWRSLEGLPNRGAVRFFPKGPSSCAVELTVSYEVPQLLVPVASALQPFLESLLVRGLERFAKFAKSYSTDSSSR